MGTLLAYGDLTTYAWRRGSRQQALRISKWLSGCRRKLNGAVTGELGTPLVTPPLDPSFPTYEIPY